MKKTRKNLAGLVVTALLVATFASCSPKEEVSESTDGIMEITLAGAMNFEFLPEEDALAQMVVDKFGIMFENVPYEGDVEKIMLEGQSDDFANVLYTSALYDLYAFSTFVDQGFFRPIPEEILNDFPLTKKLMEESAVTQAAKGQHGAYYMIPKPDSLDPSFYVAERKGIFYRKDWLENVGITEEPKTFEDLYEMAKAFTLEDPDENGKNDTYGLTADGMGNFRYFFAALGHSNLNWVKDENGSWTHGALMQDNIEALEWFRKMYEEGYLDPELGNTDYTQAMQKFASGQFGAVNRNADADWINTVVVLNFSAAQPQFEDPFDVVGMIPILAMDDDTKPGMDKYIDTMTATHFSSTCSDETMRRYLEFHEWLLTEDGQLSALGIENVDWKRNGEQIVMILGEDGMPPNTTLKYPSLSAFGMASWGFHLRADENVESFMTFNDEIKALNTEAREKRNPYAIESDMRVKMLDDEALLDANSFKFSVEYANIVMGKEPVDVMFNDMVDRAMASGFTQAIEYVNETADVNGW